MDRLATVTTPQGDDFDISYDLAGRMLTRNAPNNSVTTRAYEAFTGRLSRYTQSVGGVAFSDFSYAYTDRGNIAEIIESGTGATARTRRYSYDNIERLIDATTVAFFDLNRFTGSIY